MAYGVKYRLEFSDVLGNGKKIEILKDNYSGAVLPLIGTADPVSIKWESDDDFYSPIIGSTCTLNLFVTNDVQYDNFYAFDEEEFQVKIYYKNDVNNYILYWAGFIVTDSYKQALMSPPYQISLQANDGLGLLSTKLVTIDSNDRFTSNVAGSSTFVDNFIGSCLSKTNLDLDVYFSTGLRIGNQLTGYLEDNYIGFGAGKYKKDLKVKNCKEYIEDACRTYNLRIFQALGNWYVISNSDYMDFDFFEDIFDGTIQQEIRNEDTKRLQTELDERPQFRIYDGTNPQSGTNIPLDVFLKTKTDLTPIDNDLTVEYIPPAKIVEDNLSQQVFNNAIKIANYDPTFEIGTTDWTIVSSRGTIGEFDFVTSGIKSFKTTQKTSSQSTYTEMLKSNNAPVTGIGIDDKVFFKGAFYFDGTTNAAVFNYDIKRTYSSTVRYWNAENDTWNLTTQNNIISVNEENEWQTFSKSMTNDVSATSYEFQIIIYLPYSISGSTMSGFYIDDLRIEKEFDNFKDTSFSQNRTVNSNKIDADYQPLSIQLNAVNSVRRAQAQSVQRAPIATTQQKMNDYRTHLTRYEGTFYNNNKTPVSLRNKIWIDFTKVFIQYVDGGQETNRIYTNDSVSDISVGDYVTGGTGQSKITTDIQVTQIVTGSPNYIVLDTDLQITPSIDDVFAITEQSFVNFPISNEYPTHEPVSCMIDSMEYNVKANTFKVVMHVPNQGDDVQATFKQSTQ